MKFNFDPRGVETVYQLSLIKRLFQLLESQLEIAQTQTIEELEAAFTIDSQEACDEMRSIVGSQESHHEEEAQALRSAEMVRLYMVLERELKRFCSSIKSANGLTKNLGGYKGSLVRRAKAFLCGDAKLIASTDSIWEELEDFRILRVYLIHSSEDNDNQRAVDEFMALTSKRSDLGLGDEYELTLLRSTCDYFHRVTERFFMLLFAAAGWNAFRQNGPLFDQGS
jgi:hypothetical protein